MWTRLFMPLALALVMSGCRTVWVHDCWYPERYARESAECQAQHREQRAALRELSRPERAARPVVHWKDCMVARGWRTEIGNRSSSASKPGRGAAFMTSRVRRSARTPTCGRDYQEGRSQPGTPAPHRWIDQDL